MAPVPRSGARKYDNRCDFTRDDDRARYEISKFLSKILAMSCHGHELGSRRVRPFAIGVGLSRPKSQP